MRKCHFFPKLRLLAILIIIIKGYNTNSQYLQRSFCTSSPVLKKFILFYLSVFELWVKGHSVSLSGLMPQLNWHYSFSTSMFGVSPVSVIFLSVNWSLLLSPSSSVILVLQKPGCWIVVHKIHVPHPLDPFVSWRTLGLFLFPKCSGHSKMLSPPGKCRRIVHLGWSYGRFIF